MKSHLSLMTLPQHDDTTTAPAVVAMAAWIEDTSLQKGRILSFMHWMAATCNRNFSEADKSNICSDIYCPDCVFRNLSNLNMASTPEGKQNFFEVS